MTKNIAITYIQIQEKLAEKLVLFINEKKKLKIVPFYKNIIENTKECMVYTISTQKNLRKNNLKNGQKKLEN